MGNFNMTDLLKLRDSLSKLVGKEQDIAEGACKECARQLLNRTIKRTPVSLNKNKGQLRRGWTTTKPERTGTGVTIEMINNVNYAPYVEYGHRQQPGRFVPAIGKRLKKSWVPGQFMMTRSAEEVEKIMPQICEKHITKALKEAGL